MKVRLLMIAVAVLAGCRKAPATDAPSAVELLPPVKVETAPVQHQQMPRFLTLTGTILPDRLSEVAANVVGRIAATTVERGKAVKQGDILAIVDSKAAGFSAAAAVAQSQMAENQVELAKQECARADTLFAQGALSKAEFDRLKSQCNAELFKATSARANADLAAKLAGDTVIRAPIDGLIGERYINVGEYVQPMTRVASIFAINPVRVSISVPEAAVGLIKEGQTLSVRVSAWPNQSFPAVVRFISPVLRANTRDLVIEASAPNPEVRLKPGMFATVMLQTGEDEQPTVPKEAVKAEGTTKRIFLARGGQAFEMVVRIGVEKDGRVAVIEPLTAGDNVIVKPPPGLHDGSLIQ